MSISKEDYHFSKDDLEFLISCACRYNIGRCTYSPHMFIEMIEKNINAVSPRLRQWILDDIRKADGHLGMDIDAVRWRELARKLEEKS